MNWDFHIEGKKYSVSIDSDSGHVIGVDGKPLKFDFIGSPDGERFLIIKRGKPYEIILRELEKGEIALTTSCGLLSAKLSDEKDIKSYLNNKKGSFDEKVVASIMPGKVVKVFASVGMKVQVGDPLLVVEAMKMENELKSPSSGVVKTVNALEGKSIEANVPLVVIE